VRKLFIEPSTSFNPGLSDTLEDGRYKLDVEQALSGVVEAKSLDEMQGAHAQTIMQVLTVLVSTCVPLLPFFFHIVTRSGRTTFTGALSNGAMWRFYAAEKDGESGYQVYSSDFYAANRHGGLIMELLKDTVTDFCLVYRQLLTQSL
jgi:hypothetical protein